MDKEFIIVIMSIILDLELVAFYTNSVIQQKADPLYPKVHAQKYFPLKKDVSILIFKVYATAAIAS